MVVATRSSLSREAGKSVRGSRIRSFIGAHPAASQARLSNRSAIRAGTRCPFGVCRANL